MSRATRLRAIYAGLALLTVGLGLLSRSSLFESVTFVRLYVGDSLWALMAYWIAGALKPEWPRLHRFIAALAFAYSIECSQLYHAPWIDEFRATRMGGLILGFGFKLSDLIAYLAGVLSGLATDKFVVSKAAPSAA